MDSAHFEERLYMAIDPDVPQEFRSDIVMGCYYMARAQMHGLLGIIANTDTTDETHRLAVEQLEALHGFLSTKLGKAVQS